MPRADAAPTRLEDKGLVEWLREVCQAAPRVGSICTGALVAARAGLLDGPATTHWAYCAELTASGVEVSSDALFVKSGRVHTSAGVTTGMDMALAMVEEDWGQPVALAVAQELVFYLKRPGGQSQFSRILASQMKESIRFQQLCLWIQENLDRDLRVPSRHPWSRRGHWRRRRFHRGLERRHRVQRRRGLGAAVRPGRYAGGGGAGARRHR